MKIAFLVTRLEKPSARYRVLQYLPFLEKEGFSPSVHVIPKSTRDRAKLFCAMREYDLCFLQKKLLNAVEWHMLRKYSRRIVYDFDDAVMFRDSARRSLSSVMRMNNFVRTVKNADLVIAGNEYLRDFAVKENPNTVVIPTALDVRRYSLKSFGHASGSVTLGWIGSGATLLYLERMKHVWDSTFDRYPVARLKIVADRFFDSERIPVIKKQWRYDDEIEDLHSFDIGLMPLTDDPWSRGKCGFKLLQYMAAGLPSVCSPVGVNREIVTDGESGFWASTDHEWCEKIGLLIEDDSLRSRMGKNARVVVEQRFSAEFHGENLAGLLKAVLSDAVVCNETRR